MRTFFLGDGALRDLEGLYDSHFHIDEMTRKGIDVDDLFTKLFERGWRGGIDVVTDPGASDHRHDAPAGFPGVFRSAGLYPHEAENDWEEKIPALRGLLEDRKVVAVGEIGMDRFHDYATPSRQADLFSAQIAIADDSGLPIIIHCRDAEADVHALLKANPPNRGGVVHCFSSSYEWAKKFLDLGLFLSFAGNVTYRKNTELRRTAAAVPIDRILVETDSPYLAPEGFRGRPSNPAHVAEVCRCIAEAKSMDEAVLRARIEDNLKRCFPLMTARNG